MKRTKETLAALELPRQHARILPGYGWIPLDDGWVKINTDAGIDFDASKAGSGGIARNTSGFIGVWSKPYSGAIDSMIAEALLWDGVIFAKHRGFTVIVMETDCKEVVDLWNLRAGSHAIIAPILQDIEGLVFFF
jgi:hypothetical protein